MKTTECNKTKYGYFAPFDFETYKKIKKIKAVCNISFLRARRYDRWARKTPKNRVGKIPVICELFDEITFQMVPVYNSYNYKTSKYDIYNRIDFCKAKELRRHILEVWDYSRAKPTLDLIKNEPECLSNINIDELYVQCKQWFIESY